MAWGNGNNAGSDFDKLCLKIAQNETQSDSLTILRSKYAAIWESQGCAKKLAQALSTNRTLGELICIGLEFDVAACERLAEALSMNDALRGLHIGGSGFGDEHVRALLKNQNLGSVEKLMFERRNLTSGCCESIASTLADPRSSLTSVMLSGNQLGDEGVALLASGFKKGSKLKQLFLRDCNLGTTSIETLERALTQADIHLNRLDVSHNPAIGPKGFAAMASIQVEHISADRCNGGDSGCTALLLGSRGHLTYASIADNGVTPEGARSLSEAAWLGRENPLSLNLRENTLGDAGLAHICDVLENRLASHSGNGALVPALDLSLVGATALPPVLLRAVSTLLFMGNGPLDHLQLSSSLSGITKSSIRALSLTGTGIVDLVPVLRALHRHPTLHTIEFGGIQLTYQAHEELRILREANPNLDVAIDRGTNEEGGGSDGPSTQAPPF